MVMTSRPAADTAHSATDNALILCDNLVKIYKVADLEVVALQGLDMIVDKGEFIALVGASGSGKSTLMNILGGLDVPSAGRAVVDGHVLGQMGRRERTTYRRSVIGFVWQQTARNLLPYLSARQNVELPMLLNGVGRGDRQRRAEELLGRVGLADRADHRPDRLSGGEQQRTAIAVALSNEPSVLFADEPTGELDTTTAHEVFDVLRTVNKELGVTIVVVTHDPLVSEQVTRTIAIRDGRTSTETLRRGAISEAGDHHLVSEEYAVLDRVGRLQLPRAYVDALGLSRRVRLALEDDHIIVWPDNGTTRLRPPVVATPATSQPAPTTTQPAATQPSATQPPVAAPARSAPAWTSTREATKPADAADEHWQYRPPAERGDGGPKS
jgi:ABC-type lipoprotein export system ATPase subunit